MSFFEDLVAGLIARGDVPDTLIVKLVEARIAQLEAEILRLQAEHSFRSSAALIDRHIETEEMLTFVKSVEATIEAL